MLDGFFVNGPLLHYAYELLDHIIPAETSVLWAILQVIMGAHARICERCSSESRAQSRQLPPWMPRV